MTVEIVSELANEPTQNSLKLKSKQIPEVSILDIRHETDGYSIVKDIKDGLRPRNGGEKNLPTLLLYDENGLRLFEKITFLKEYYLTPNEIQILETYASRIAERIKPGSIIVELGSGNLRKIEILLRAIDRAEKNVEYYALDLSLIELQRTLSAVPAGSFKHVKCFGLHGTYDDGLKWLQSREVVKKPKSILTMGSSIGNFNRPDAARFLKSFASILQEGDSILVGLDACKNPEKVFHAYNDEEGVTHEFILNGLRHANRLLGANYFDLEDWKVIGEYDRVAGRHHAFVSPRKDVVIDGVLVRKDERVRIEESYKYSLDEANQLWENAGLVEGAKWTNQRGDYALHMAYKPAFKFSTQPEEYAATAVPSISDWENLWAVWDTVTLRMIPEDELLSKPIKLRNACIFYLGHIPTFLDIHLSNATGEFSKELKYYQQIFERGIDPDVDNPELCHDHSEIPDSWPPAKEIMVYQGRVREKVRSILTSNAVTTTPALRKALWIGFEHEAMHLETLLYMLIQSEKTLPPHGAVKPDFESLAREAENNTVSNEWFEIPNRNIVIGMNDVDSYSTKGQYFGWDNEIPRRYAGVKSFSAKARPITNREYLQFLQATGRDDLPASWTDSAPNSKGGLNGHVSSYKFTNGYASSYIEDKAVRTVFGNIPLKFALDWPVMASYDELEGCARWMGGRIPTMNEVRSIYEHVEELKRKEFEKSIGKKIPAVNGHLVNNGVEETPPSNGQLQRLSNGSSQSLSDLFVNLQGANVGFSHWHPVPVTMNKNLAGQSETGGTWEWTSSVLEKHEGFEPMALYPAYTADFFDGKHNIVLGGSWATHPRLAGRKSFVNWYQRNYPYVWAGARLVKDD